MRRDFHEHMDMFSRQNAGDDLDAKFFAQLPDNRSYPLPQRAFQHLVAILRDPDDVIPMVKNRVTPLVQKSRYAKRNRGRRSDALRGSASDRLPICSRTGSTSARPPIGVKCIAASMS